MSNYCRSGIYMTIPLDHVEASTETVFDVFLDVERLPTMSTQIESTELIVTGKNSNNDHSCVVGRKWKERRNYEGRILKDIFTVTSMTRTLDKATGEDVITVTYSIDFVKNNFKTRQATQTGSLTAHPTSEAGDKRTCRLTMTVSFVAEGCISGTLVRCCRAGIERYGELYGLQALSELAAAARRRQKEINLQVDEK